MTHTRSQFLLAAAVFGLAMSSGAEAQSAGGQGPQGLRPPAGQRGGPDGQMQRRGPGAPGAMGERGNRAGRGARGNPAAMLLRLRSELSLTDDQVKRLEALRNTPAPKSNASELLRARADLMDAMQGDGNLPKARTALDRMSALRNERMIGGLKLRQDARAVLTAEQKTTLDNMRSAMRGTMRDDARQGLRDGRGGGRAGRGQRIPGGQRGIRRGDAPGSMRGRGGES